MVQCSVSPTLISEYSFSPPYPTVPNRPSGSRIGDYVRGAGSNVPLGRLDHSSSAIIFENCTVYSTVLFTVYTTVTVHAQRKTEIFQRSSSCMKKRKRGVVPKRAVGVYGKRGIL